MRHRRAGRALGRTSSHRKALIRNQVTDLLRHERIVTTEAKAKELRPAAEKVITLGKRGDLHARRQAAAVLTDRKIVTRLFDELAPRYRDRPGGYTRIIKLGPRRGDGAHMAQIELVETGGAAGIMTGVGETEDDAAAVEAAEDIAPDTDDEPVDEAEGTEDADEDAGDEADEAADEEETPVASVDDEADDDAADEDTPDDADDEADSDDEAEASAEAESDDDEAEKEES